MAASEGAMKLDLLLNKTVAFPSLIVSPIYHLLVLSSAEPSFGLHFAPVCLTLWSPRRPSLI